MLWKVAQKHRQQLASDVGVGGGLIGLNPHPVESDVISQ